jgi:hypothetical protein
MSIFTKSPSDGEKKKSSVISTLFTLIVFGGVAYYLYGGGIEEGVANDVIDQYNLVAETGDYMQMCVRAGLVAEAYLQAKNQTEYLNWTEIKKNDCAAAGLPG